MTPNPALDVATEVPVLEPDRKLACSVPRFDPGGGGVNVAKVVRGLGHPATAVFTSGGPTGQRLEQLLAEGASHHPGIVAVAVPIAQETRESITVTEASSHRQFRLVLPGPALTAQEWSHLQTHTTALAPSHQLSVLSGSFPAEGNVAAVTAMLRTLRTLSDVLVVDTSGRALKLAAAVGADVLKPSLNELEGFAGSTLHGASEIIPAARALLERGPNGAVLVSLAASGAILVQRHDHQAWQVHAPPVRVVSTVGAGDSLVGALCVALLSGHAMLDAVRYGVAAGTAAVLAPGSGLCKPADIDRLHHEVRVTALN
ncbi:MAG: 1-phosphofructokinase family hexose kinase [Acidimicrobiales bacterium]